MKKYIISAFALFTLFTTSGCQDWLDVNHDPNVLEEIPDGKVLLPAAEVNLGNSLMGWDFGLPEASGRNTGRRNIRLPSSSRFANIRKPVSVPPIVILRPVY